MKTKLFILIGIFCFVSACVYKTGYDIVVPKNYSEPDIHNYGTYCEKNNYVYIVLLDLSKSFVTRFKNAITGNDGYVYIKVDGGHFLNNTSIIHIKRFPIISQQKTYAIWAYPIIDEPRIVEYNNISANKFNKLKGKFILNFKKEFGLPTYLSLLAQSKNKIKILFKIPLYCK